MINVENVSFIYNGKPVLEDISFYLSQGTFAGLIGPNGGGKTTLLKLILGLYKPQKGSLKVFGQESYKLGKERFRIGYVPQLNHFNPDYPISVFDLVLMGLSGKLGIFSKPSEEDKKYAKELLAMFNLLDRADDSVHLLSGGQLQKAHIARALITKPEIMLFDEATVGLDAVSQSRFYDFILEIKKEFKLTIIMVSHDIEILNAKTDITLCLNKKLHCHAQSRRLTESEILEAYSCELDDFTVFRKGLK